MIYALGAAFYCFMIGVYYQTVKHKYYSKNDWNYDKEEWTAAAIFPILWPISFPVVFGAWFVQFISNIMKAK